MKICRSLQELHDYRKSTQQSIGFVPTMGALHQGHVALMARSKKECELLVVSIFVNPTQFLKGEDLNAYPKQEAKDIEICKRIGVNCLFLPQAHELYLEDEPTVLAPNIRGYTLEGAMRPGHFDGMLQIVLKLFNLVQPTKAYFGKKDAQQLALIRLMVERFFLPLEIVAVDTVRESDGLALSSRNVYLNAQERQESLAISKALKAASQKVVAKEYRIDIIELQMREIMASLEIQYIAFINRRFEKISAIEPTNTIIAVACKVGTTRLIDNVWI